MKFSHFPLNTFFMLLLFFILVDKSVSQTGYKVTVGFGDLVNEKEDPICLTCKGSFYSGSVFIRKYQVSYDGKQGANTFSNSSGPYAYLVKKIQGSNDFISVLLNERKRFQGAFVLNEGIPLSFEEVKSLKIILAQNVKYRHVNAFVNENRTHSWCLECNDARSPGDYTVDMSDFAGRYANLRTGSVVINRELKYVNTLVNDPESRISLTYNVRVEAVPLHCQSAPSLVNGRETFSSNAVSSLFNDFNTYVPDLRACPTCDTKKLFAAREKIFQYQHEGGNLNVSLRTSHSRLRVFVTRSCSSSQYLMMVSPNSSTAREQEPGLYYIIVDGQAGAAGDFSILARSLR